MTSVSAQAPFDTVESAIQDIAAGRLVILPEAALCTACAGA